MKIRASEIARAWPTTVQVQFRMTEDSGVRKDSRGIRSSICQLSASVQTQHNMSEIVIGCCSLLQSHVPYVHRAAAIGHTLHLTTSMTFIGQQVKLSQDCNALSQWFSFPQKRRLGYGLS